MRSRASKTGVTKLEPRDQNKLTATPTARHLDPLNRLKALMGAEAAEQGLLVCTCDAERPLPGGNLAMPWQRFPAWIAGLLGERTARHSRPSP